MIYPLPQIIGYESVVKKFYLNILKRGVHYVELLTIVYNMFLKYSANTARTVRMSNKARTVVFFCRGDV